MFSSFLAKWNFCLTSIRFTHLSHGWRQVVLVTTCECRTCSWRAWGSHKPWRFTSILEEHNFGQGPETLGWEQRWEKRIKNIKSERWLKKGPACYPEPEERKDKVYFCRDTMGRQIHKSLFHSKRLSLSASGCSNMRTPCLQTTPSVPSRYSPQLQRWGWETINFTKRRYEAVRARLQQSFLDEWNAPSRRNELRVSLHG